MALKYGPNLGALVNGASGEEHYDALMAQFRAFDALIQPHVLEMELVEPPAGPIDGACYIVGVGATGLWATKDRNIARWTDDFGGGSWQFFAPKPGWTVYVEDKARTYRYNGSAWTRRAEELQVIPVACGDETTGLTAADGLVTFHVPFDTFTLHEVFAGLTVEQTSGTVLTVDVNADDVSIFSTAISIDNGETTSLTAAVPAVLSTTALTKGTKITIDLDSVGDGTAMGLKVYMVGWL